MRSKAIKRTLRNQKIFLAKSQVVFHLSMRMGSALPSTIGRSNGVQGHWCWSLLPVVGMNWATLDGKQLITVKP